MRTLVGTLPPDPDPGRRPSRRIRVIQYLREVANECRKVTAPSRSEVLTYSAVSVLWVASVTSLIVGLDVLFAKGVLRALGL